MVPRIFSGVLEILLEVSEIFSGASEILLGFLREGRGQIMKDLIKQWLRLAERYRLKAKNEEGFVYERLQASADALEMCAQQLEEKLDNS